MLGRYRTSLLVAASVLVAVSIGYAAMYVLRGALLPSETTDIDEYTTILKQWSPSGLVGHFPASISPQAQQVRLSAYPGHLQGGAYIQLRMQLPSAEIQRIEAQLKRIAQVASKDGGMLSSNNEEAVDKVPTPNFHTSDLPASSAFPDHYTLYILSSIDRGGRWNHGQTSGTAVSTVANEVVYWAESW
jgi:hypothetical protein